MKKLLVTGAAGFIGSNFVRYMLDKYDDYEITVFDALTYAGHLENLEDVKDDPRFKFIKGDIRKAEDVEEPVKNSDIVINFAAESHVDRSIADAENTMNTNVMGVLTLCEAARRHDIERFVQISTDEVYGDIDEGFSKETDPLSPNSPYSAGKTGGELLARSYYRTYGLPVIVTRGSNTYGPYQQPEKLVPLFVSNAMEGKSLPVYGDGMQIRDWLHVMDHCSGVDCALHKGEPGGIYNIGGGNQRPNIEIIKIILEVTGKDESLIKHVADRPGHDRRYALDASKLLGMGWQRTHDFETAMRDTVRWYMDNTAWWKKIKESEENKEFADKWYANRK
ncbi:MAG: dTDP-glucose 4,6-dehydratase [Abditibacteriota bacterium]|nr:dTDP-glucose 4,6-dehydratase [Abditibacteriota bacterium]MBP5092663.1 dTDP-glucose 4,6-dehydratase [Abditibacteriota bacterium]MBP5737539.1 dTDP-glucose 4,6-dehydratase [Abditibacteriota bacterium]